MSMTWDVCGWSMPRFVKNDKNTSRRNKFIYERSSDKTVEIYLLWIETEMEVKCEIRSLQGLEIRVYHFRRGISKENKHTMYRLFIYKADTSFFALRNGCIIQATSNFLNIPEAILYFTARTPRNVRHGRVSSSMCW